MKAKKPFTRRLHDGYTSLVASLGFKLRRADPTNLPSSVKCYHTHPAGSAVFENTLEQSFYSDSNPSSAGYSWSETRLYVIKDALVTGDQGSVFLSNGLCLSVCPSLHDIPDRKIRRPLTAFAEFIDFPVLHLTGRDHENHGHFLTQHLPRLIAWLLHEKLPDQVKILVPPGHKKWQSRYLNLLGFTSENIIEGSPGTLRIKQLFYCPMLQGNSYLANPLYYLELKKRFLTSTPSNANSGKTLFITRTTAPNRRLQNEGEVVQELRNYFPNLILINLADYSLSEQIALCQSASVIIGPQGQGMSVLLFQKKGLSLILEYGDAPRPLGWCAAFRDISLMAGIQSLRLFSGKGLEVNGDWIYPLGKLKLELQQLAKKLPL